MSISIKYLQEYIKSNNYRPELKEKYYMKLAEEIGELSRAMRKNLRPSSENEIKGTIDEELWDVIYYAVALANCYDIDLEKVIPQKEKLNNEKYSDAIPFETTPKYSPDFWLALDKLVSKSRIIIDRPKGSRHPKYPDFMYPVDYGYLENTSSMDGGGIDVWKGTNSENIDAIICTVDLMKKDSEVKILIGCSEDEKRIVLEAHNNSEYMKGILIRRDT